ncbi:MAG: hypothetical protein KGS46_21250 [Chloroflexi bacterium]|nr:hypothetical protein [Chloroflexota bacterium]
MLPNWPPPTPPIQKYRGQPPPNHSQRS